MQLHGRSSSTSRRAENYGELGQLHTAHHSQGHEKLVLRIQMIAFQAIMRRVLTNGITQGGLAEENQTTALLALTTPH